jgi:hypothetical protein
MKLSIELPNSPIRTIPEMMRYSVFMLPALQLKISEYKKPPPTRVMIIDTKAQ